MELRQLKYFIKAKELSNDENGIVKVCGISY
jgi:hypothetical protein